MRYYHNGGTIENCKSIDNGICGIFLHRTFGVEIKNCDIRGNEIGIEEGDSGNHNHIHNNYLCNTQNIATTGTDTIIENNEEC